MRVNWRPELARVYFGLAIYFGAVGVFGLLRTGSVVPLLITGGAGVITALLGMRLRVGSHIARKLGLVWFVTFATASLYSAFGSISAHTQARPEAIYIFLSMALLCVVALVLTIRAPRTD
jgi:hypothetical protein